MSNNIETVEDSDEYNFRQLMDTIYEVKDIILTIPEDQLQELKDGLQDRKAKDNVALKKRGALPVTETLNFLSYPATDKKGNELEGQISVRIKLLPRRSIDIIKMEIPTDEL